MIDQTEFMKAYFLYRPDELIESYEAEDDLRRAWLALTGKKFYDAGRKLRKLRDSGFVDRIPERGGITHYRLAEKSCQPVVEPPSNE